MKNGSLDKLVNLSPDQNNKAKTKLETLKYPLDPKATITRNSALKYHESGRTFRTNEENLRIYMRNLQLQQKLDIITSKGTGNYGLNKTFRTIDRKNSPHLVPDLKTFLKPKE